MTKKVRNQFSLNRKQPQQSEVDTGAAIVNGDRTGTVERCREFTTLAIPSAGVCLHCGVKNFAGEVSVQMKCGRGGDDYTLVE